MHACRARPSGLLGICHTVVHIIINTYMCAPRMERNYYSDGYYYFILCTHLCSFVHSFVHILLSSLSFRTHLFSLVPMRFGVFFFPRFIFFSFEAGSCAQMFVSLNSCYLFPIGMAKVPSVRARSHIYDGTCSIRGFCSIVAGNLAPCAYCAQKGTSRFPFVSTHNNG